MKFTLKDYQADAVQDVLNRLDLARDMYRRTSPATSAFSLSAVTGAGKTVMAAAVLEALFEGSEDFEFAADPGAVVLWFTDDPSLNEQTRFRLLEASDLPHGRLRVIHSDFQAEKLGPGHVYFLNAQKLGRNSLLVRGTPEDRDDALPSLPAAPDLRANTMWDILRNTIEDERLTLYLVLDEAHKGMKKPSTRESNERQTIVRRLINGDGGSPPVPVVWGISATVQRFDEAMRDVGGRVHLPPVEVDAARVQESGLLKDDIRLEFPSESGVFDTVLLARAVRRTQEASELWAEYAAGQDPPLDPVIPLLVVQLPNTANERQLAEIMGPAIRTVRDAWPGLADDALAHVLGEHRSIELAGATVPHIAPEKVQESTWVRVLFAKDAISTGWDCPRAEVLMSFRPASDETHITQLLGRMVRTPLARRIPGDDRLNAVECVLPRFDRTTAVKVGELLMGRRDGDTGGSGGGTGRRSLYAPVDLRPNPAVGEVVWQAFDAMPSQTLPRKAARPVKRLMALAQELSRDGLRPGARRVAIDELCAVLAGQAVRHRDLLAAADEDIREASGESVVVRAGREEHASDSFAEIADDRAVEAEFAVACRTLTREIAIAYADSIAVDDDHDDGLFDAHVHVAALARLAGVAEELDRAAELLAVRWFDEFRVGVKELSDERRAVYEEIKAMAATPQRIDVLRPRVRIESTLDERGLPVDRVPGHLMSDPDGGFPVGSLNHWERAVLERESARPGFRAWYRNPSRASVDALAIAYRDQHETWRRMCPDFVFFHGRGDAVRPSIVDPHGVHLADALPKLRGLADFAEAYGEAFHRIEAVADLGHSLRVLDLQRPDVRVAVREADDVEGLYASRRAAAYV